MKGRHDQWIRVLLIGKIIVLIGLWIAWEKGILIGEKPLVAEEEKKQPDDKGPDQQANDSVVDTLRKLLEFPPIDRQQIRKDEIGKYLMLIDQKRQHIEQRVTLLQQKEEHMRRIEKVIEDKLIKLDEERKLFAQTLQREKDLKGERLDRLLQLYEKMEPKKAAPVLEKIDRDLGVALLHGLRQKQVTAILENMNPDKSVEISEYYGRVRSTKEYDILKEMNQSLRKAFDECKPPPLAQVQAGQTADTRSPSP